jgi:hypothetical protein
MKFKTILKTIFRKYLLNFFKILINLASHIGRDAIFNLLGGIRVNFFSYLSLVLVLCREHYLLNLLQSYLVVLTNTLDLLGVDWQKQGKFSTSPIKQLKNKPSGVFEFLVRCLIDCMLSYFPHLTSVRRCSCKFSSFFDQKRTFPVSS